MNNVSWFFALIVLFCCSSRFCFSLCSIVHFQRIFHGFKFGGASPLQAQVWKLPGPTTERVFVEYPLELDYIHLSAFLVPFRSPPLAFFPSSTTALSSILSQSPSPHPPFHLFVMEPLQLIFTARFAIDQFPRRRGTVRRGRMASRAPINRLPHSLP